MVRETKPCASNFSAWPEAVNISVKRGFILSGMLFVLPSMIIDVAIYLGLDPDVDSFEDGYNLIALYIFIAIFVLSLIKYFARIPIQKMFFCRIPSVWDIVIWSCVGLILGSVRILPSLREGYRFEEPLFFLFMFYALILKSILYPLVEEPIYRGIIFVALYNWKGNRFIAYVGSSFIFLFYHFVSFIPLGFNSLSYFHIVFILLFAFIAAYLYDRRGNILLCMLVHGIPNGSDFIGGLLGYLLGVRSPGDNPAIPSLFEW